MTGAGGGPPHPPITRRLVVEVVDARDLIPKDGQGTSNPYVVADFDGQRKRTRTVPRTLNPEWHEKIEFVVTDPDAMDAEELEVEVYNDKRAGSTTPGGARKSHFLGRVRIYGSQFARMGEEGLIYFPLEKKSVFSWIRGEIGLKIYYYDEIAGAGGDEKKPEGSDQKAEQGGEEKRDHHQPPPQELPQPTEAAVESQPPPPVSVVVVEEAPPAPEPSPPPQEDQPPLPPEVRKMQTSSAPGSTEKVRVHSRRYNCGGGDLAPRTISGRFSSPAADGPVPDRVPYDLVEPMTYLFVRVVRARGIRPCENPYVKVRAGSHVLRSHPAPDASGGNPDWNQVFRISLAQPEPTLEISVWDPAAGGPESFLGSVLFNVPDVPVRDQPDAPLAPQWFRLKGTDDGNPDTPVTGDINVSVWIGTQADDAFPESWSSEKPYVAYTRSKVYQSPKLWYLRVSVLEAQDLRVMPPPRGSPLDIRVKVQMGFQSARTRRPIVSGNSTTFSWHEDLLFVASEPLDDQLVVLVEDRSTKEPALLGIVMIGTATVEQRLDERLVASKWFNLETGDGIGPGTGPLPPPGPNGPNGQPPPMAPASSYGGRVHLRMCLEGGYHVLDEAAHVCSDYRPTAKQLWQPAVGVLELGILGARSLLPMKTKGGAKGSTDAYCVAKYGKKWVRTATVTDSFDPRWNEQYTWRVYDPCTVLTIGVFDNWRMFADDQPDYCIGKVRIRISTLESNRVYTHSYPLLVLLRSGVKKMGEIEMAVRFAYPALLPDTCALYSQPLLPRMHYLRPIGVAQQEALRFAAIKMVAGWLARSEPPMGPEVVRYMLDADSHTWSMRRSKTNWFRIMGVLSWAVGLARWVDDIRRWRNRVKTILVHFLYLVLVWYPELVVPTGFVYMVMIGSWYYRFRPRVPAGMDARMSQAEAVDADELDEEFDAIPSSKQYEVLRARYDRLRTLAGRVQTVMGDFAAQGERVQALVSWRDPRATRLFIGACTVAALVLYLVPPKMVAVALGFYFLRHPMFRDPMPPAGLNFFRRLPSLSDRLL